MTHAKLLSQITAQGIRLEIKEGRLFALPKDKVTPELFETLKAQKQALLSLLEPKRNQDNEDCPDHWLHIPILPPKGERVTTTNEGKGLRYRVCLFGHWYIIRFCPNISETQIEITGQDEKRRAFADLHEFYRWAWSEQFHAEICFRVAN
jgi:TubC N-terminal docking domain